MTLQLLWSGLGGSRSFVAIQKVFYGEIDTFRGAIMSDNRRGRRLV